MRHLLTILILCFVASVAHAQKTTKKTKEAKTTEAGPNSMNPNSGPNFTPPPPAPKKTKKGTAKSYEDYLASLRKEREKRIVKTAKMDRKMAREMDKPKYSDPSYFGHKRKPKKRGRKKRKLCKECHIVH